MSIALFSDAILLTPSLRLLRKGYVGKDYVAESYIGLYEKATKYVTKRATLLQYVHGLVYIMLACKRWLVSAGFRWLAMSLSAEGSLRSSVARSSCADRLAMALAYNHPATAKLLANERRASP